MHRRILKPMMLASFAALFAIPASAQVRADLGPLHIRIANDAPPHARYEARTSRPYTDAMWVNGYWHWQDTQWAWTNGRWDRPSDRNVRWVDAKYQREGCSWYHQTNCRWRYEPAHWSNQQLVEGEDYRQWRNERYGHDRH